MDAIETLQDLVRLPSFTPKNKATESEDFAACLATLDVTEELLIPLGASTVRLVHEGNELAPYPVANLIAHLQKGHAGHTLFYSGHTDVVGLVDEKLWTVPPFGGEIRDGFLYGRGSTDMKAGIVAFIAAMSEQLAEMPDYDIYVMITTDEEWTGANGTLQALRYLKDKGIVPSAVLVGEPASNKRVGDSVRRGRRGSLSGLLEATGKAGHVAYPQLTVNPIRHITQAKYAILGMEYEQDGLGAEGTNLEFTYENSGNPKDGGNVPAFAEARFNVRFTANYSVESMSALINKALEDMGVDRSIVKLTLFPQVASKPFTSPLGWLADCIRQAVRQECALEPEFNRAGGTSDGKHVYTVYDPREDERYAKIEILELGSCNTGGFVEGDPDFGKKGGIHEIDERILLSDLHLLIKVYGNLLKRYFS